MLRAAALLLVLASSAGAMPWAPAAGNPYAQEVRAALADARKLDPVTASLTRYFSFRQVFAALPAEKQGEARKTIDLWTNGLSREAEFGRIRFVTPTVFAVRVDDYGWDPETWEKLADEDPYYHVQVDLIVGVAKQKRYFKADGKSRAGWYEIDPPAVARRVAALAPWASGPDAAELVALTQSAAPIVRADWWFSRAAIQFGRNGTGYYDWLQAKDLKEFDELVGFDRKKSQAVKREVAAIVARSGVSNFPRQVFREQSVTGGRWETRDRITDNKDAGNPLRQLDADFKPEAFEIYGVLPNGLFGFFLADGKGGRQDSAPDGIGFDRTAPGNDGKIHVGLGCARCHAEGLRPVADWGRRVYSSGLSLNSPDVAKHRRLVQLYLGELDEYRDDDIAFYARKLKKLTGWKPDEAAKAVGELWRRYVEADLLPADMALELGVDEKAYLAALRAYYQANKLSDPVLASHIANPPLPIRRDDVEQLMPIIGQVILGGSTK